MKAWDFPRMRLCSAFMSSDCWASSKTRGARNCWSYVVDSMTRMEMPGRWPCRIWKAAQGKMKGWYDKNARVQELKLGSEVLVLLPLQGQPLSTKFSSLYVVERRIGKTDFLVRTPDRRKMHINMPYKHAEAIPQRTGCYTGLCCTSGSRSHCRRSGY